MMEEAAGMGFYTSPMWGEKYLRLQIMTIEEVLKEKRIASPQYKADDRIKIAPRQEKERKGRQNKLTDLPEAG